MDEIRFGNIVFIPGLNKGRYPYCNSLFIDDEIKAVIDPACNQERLLNLKETSGVDVIINSHYHEDHFAFNYLFPETDLWVPQLDAPCFKSIKNILDVMGAFGTALEPDFRDYLKSFNYEERIPAREFRDGEVLDFGRTKLEVVHTPGHTPGHSCFYCKEQNLLFTADLDMSSFGPFYGDKYSDLAQSIQSVRKLQSIPADVFITSHSKGIINGSINKEAEAYLNIISERENRVLDFLKDERTIPEMVSQWLIYKKPMEPPMFWQYSEETMLRHHLASLIQKGQIKQSGEKYVATLPSK
ncbi:MAG: MBL fold metallo-hydrolase [Smithellaceae bacterium]